MKNKILIEIDREGVKKRAESITLFNPWRKTSRKLTESEKMVYMMGYRAACEDLSTEYVREYVLHNEEDN